MIIVLNIGDKFRTKNNKIKGEIQVRVVRDKKELKINMDMLDKYIQSKKDPEYTLALSLIKKGTCFIAVKENDMYRFYPSRFTGYAYNTMDLHQNNDTKDGKETNPTITSIIGYKPIVNKELENEYKKYCDKLGFTANNKGSFGVERKYWLLHEDTF